MSIAVASPLQDPLLPFDLEGDGLASEGLDKDLHGDTNRMDEQDAMRVYGWTDGCLTLLRHDVREGASSSARAGSLPPVPAGSRGPTFLPISDSDPEVPLDL